MGVITKANVTGVCLPSGTASLQELVPPCQNPACQCISVVHMVPAGSTVNIPQCTRAWSAVKFALIRGGPPAVAGKQETSESKTAEVSTCMN